MFTHHKAGATSIFDLKTHIRIGSVLDYGSEITKDLILSVNSDSIRIYNINNLNKHVFRKEISIAYPSSTYGVVCKTVHGGALMNCIFIKGDLLWTNDITILLREVHSDLTEVCNVCLKVPEFKVALTPCGHNRYCDDCVDTLKTCIVCHEKKTGSVRVRD